MFKLRNAQVIAEELGKRVRTPRLAKNLTQEQLAARADVSVGTLSPFLDFPTNCATQGCAR